MSGSASEDPVHIRPGTERDVPAILSLIRGLAEYEKLGHECVATEDQLRATLFGARAYAETLLACAGDTPVGFALFFHNYSTFLAKPGLYLEDLFVVPEWRRHGVGRRLLSALARIAVERGCGRFEWMVLDWNAPSIAFYRSLGAAPLDDWTVFRVAGDDLARLAAGS